MTETVTTKEAQVIAAGASYFEYEPVLNPISGEARKDGQGQPVFTTLRKEALMGDVITVSTVEFDRLAALGAVREPSADPLPRDLPPAPTPFGVPLRNADDQLAAYAGPIMGDPRPHGPGNITDGRDVLPGTLTPDEAARLEAAAKEGFEPGKEPVEAPNLDDEDVTVGEVEEYISEVKPNTDATLDLARGTDGEFDERKAEIVLEAEQAQEKPRKGVVAELESALEEEDED